MPVCYITWHVLFFAQLMAAAAAPLRPVWCQGWGSAPVTVLFPSSTCQQQARVDRAEVDRGLQGFLQVVKVHGGGWGPGGWLGSGLEGLVWTPVWRVCV